jgi:hypothetical protein
MSMIVKRGIYGIWIHTSDSNGHDHIFLPFNEAEQLLEELPSILTEPRHKEP